VRALLAGLLALATACSSEENLVPPDWGLNRMIRQPRYDPYGASTFFDDGRAMRPPPEGTVPVDAPFGPIATGLEVAAGTGGATDAEGAGLPAPARGPAGPASDADATAPPGTATRAGPEDASAAAVAAAAAAGAGAPAPVPLRSIPLPLTPELVARGRDRFDVFCAPCHGSAGEGRSVVAEAMPLVKPPSLVSAELAGKPPGHVFRVITDGFGMMPRYAYQLPAEDRWAVVVYVRALQLSAGVPLASLPPALRAEAERELKK
jgi:mono/diheme cytochrome c family protein